MASTPTDHQADDTGPSLKVRLTKTHVDRAEHPASGQVYIRDTELKGFALRITPGAKSFVVEKRIDGKVRRSTLARYPELTVEQARKEAQKFLGQVASGINPIAERENTTLQHTTLGQALGDFLSARKTLKASTVRSYQQILVGAFGDWHKKPLTQISKDMVAQRHQKLGEEHGEAYANLAMRILRAVLNFAIVQYEDSAGRPLLTENPVKRLTQTRAWYRVSRRQTSIKPHELPAFWTGIQQLRQEGGQSALVADYLLLMLFTGLRRQEAAQLTWAAVDLEHATLRIEDTKNHEPLELPLSDFLLQLLKDRKAAATESSPYVFAGGGQGGYLVEPRTQLEKFARASQLAFTLHDLRRTFITIAESLDISAYAVKRLVNHKMRGDVTAGYIMADVERLRGPMQRVTDYLLKALIPGSASPAQSL